MRLLPTALGAKGALFFGVVLLMLLATPYSNLFFLLTAFLAVLGGLGAAGAWRNLRGFTAVVVAADAAPAGDRHEVAVRIGARPGRTGFGIAVWLDVCGDRRLLDTALVATDGTVVRGSVAGLPRGVHAVAAVRLWSRHPLGICAARRRLPVAATELVAYPNPTAGGAPRADASEPAATARRRTTEESVAALRDWRAGDALRDVHWRATARRGAPIVKERERDAGSGLEVVLDRRCDAGTLEGALSAAAGLVLDAQQRRLPLRLRSQGCELAHSVDRPAAAAMLRWLAAATALPADAPSPAAAAPTALWLPRPHGGHA